MSMHDQPPVNPSSRRPVEPGRPAMTIQEFCRLNGVSRSFTYQEIKRGKLYVTKSGRRTLITVEAEDAWLYGESPLAEPVSGDRPVDMPVSR
jgi:excisionase family DNA binding protein